MSVPAAALATALDVALLPTLPFQAGISMQVYAADLEAALDGVPGVHAKLCAPPFAEGRRPGWSRSRWIRYVGYPAWAAAGHIHLIDEPTISPTVTQRIAASIVAQAKARKVAAVCYDQYRATVAVGDLEKAGLRCVPVRQGYTLNAGCQDLQRWLKEGSITIAPNPVLRFCAENAEVTRDTKGNIWVVKPGAKGTYAGKRGAKVDGIVALVTALTEAHRQALAAATTKQYRGAICRL